MANGSADGQGWVTVMVPAWVVPMLIGLGFAVLATEARADDTGTDDTGPGEVPKGYGAVRATAAKYAEAIGLSSADRKWFERMAMVQAHSESRGNPLAANRTSSERAAARKAYDRNAPKMPVIVQGTDPYDWYGEFGSGGWFGLIPANGLYHLRKDARPGEFGPDDVFDPWRSTVMYAAYLQGLTNWRQFRDSDQTAYAIKRGGAAPGLMDNMPDEDDGTDRDNVSNRNLEKAMAALGIPESWARQPVPNALRVKRDWVEIVRQGEGRT